MSWGQLTRMIVDGAVVMMENSVHRLEQSHAHETPLESVRGQHMKSPDL